MLDGQTPVPDDAAALVVAAPRRDLPPGALRQIEAYLHRGGGVLVLLEPGKQRARACAELLRRYGVAVSDEVVLDGDQRMFAGDYLTMLVPGRRRTSGQRRAHVDAADVRRARRAHAPTDATEAGIDLLATAAGELAHARPQRARARRRRVRPRTRHARAGAGRRQRAGARPRAAKPGRLLVYGDADFASNLLLGYLGNRDLLLNSVNWLAGEETMLGTRPPSQAPGVNQLFISDRQGETRLLARRRHAARRDSRASG